MKVEHFTPAEVLRRYIQSYTVIESSAASETLVLPHSGMVMALQFRGRVHCKREGSTENIPLLTLSGMRRSFRRFQYEKNTGTILVKFRETGAHSFFQQPLFEFFELFEPVDNLFSRSETDRILEMISSAQNNQQRIHIIDDFLISKCSSPKADLLVIAAIDEILNNHGVKNIRSLSDSLGISQDAFEKRFRRNVGATPKQFSSIIRMKSVVNLGQHYKSLSSLAYHFDYFDQSHFIKDFRLFTGQSPKEFFKAPYPW